MKIKKWKELIKSLDDNKEVRIFNYCSEWYGTENIPLKAVEIINGNLVINFNLEWDDYDLDKYNKEET